MEIESLFILTAIFLLFLDLFQLFQGKKEQNKLTFNFGFYASTVAIAFLVIAYALFVNMFLYDNFSLIEAYSHSSSNLSILSKLHATWSGGGGSLLLLTLIISIVYFAFRFQTHEKPTSHRISAIKVLIVILIFFSVMTLIKNPFARFEGMPIEGRGLNPSLQSFWMTIHPPIVFIAYAFILLAVSLATTGLKETGQKDEVLLERSIRIAWFFLTLGIALGGIWAYTVLGWGGYWNWDPVETASLVTWLILTAYFPIKSLSKTNIDISKEFIIFLAFEALIFLSALTRGGFRQSVHAYALSPAGPIFLLFGLAMGIYFFILKRNGRFQLLPSGIEKNIRYYSLLLNFTCLMAISIGCLFGIMFPILSSFFGETINIFGANFYNIWSYPFVLGFLITLIMLDFSPKLSLKKTLTIIFFMIFSGLLLVSLVDPNISILTTFVFPFLFVSIMTSLYGLIKVSKVEKRLKFLSKKMIHLGIIITLIGVFVSAGAKQSDMLDTTPNTDLNALDLSIKLNNFTVYEGDGRVYLQNINGLSPEYTSLRLDVEILYNKIIHFGSVWSYLYVNYGYVSSPLIISTETGDIYLHLNLTESIRDSLTRAFSGELVIPEKLTLTIEKIPFVYLVWIGVVLLCIGMIFLAFHKQE